MYLIATCPSKRGSRPTTCRIAQRSSADRRPGGLPKPDEGLLHVVNEDGKTSHTFLIPQAVRPGKSVYVLRAAGEDGEIHTKFWCAISRPIARGRSPSYPHASLPRTAGADR